MYKDKVTLAEGIKRFFGEVMYVGIGDDACTEAANIIRKKVGETYPGLPFSGIRDVSHFEDTIDTDYFSAKTIGSTHEYSVVKVNGKNVIDHKSDIVLGYVAIVTRPSGKVTVGNFTNVTETPTRTICNKGIDSLIDSVTDSDIDLSEGKKNDFCSIAAMIVDLHNDGMPSRSCVFKIMLHTENVEFSEKKWGFFNTKKNRITEQYCCVDVLTMNCPTRDSAEDDDDEDAGDDDTNIPDEISNMISTPSGMIGTGVISARTPEEAIEKIQQMMKSGVSLPDMSTSNQGPDRPMGKMKIIKKDPFSSKREDVLSFLKDKVDYLEGVREISYKDSLDEICHLIQNDVVLSRLKTVKVDFDTPARLLQNTNISDMKGEYYSRFVVDINHSREVGDGVIKVPCTVNVQQGALDICNGTDKSMIRGDVMSAVVLEHEVDEKDPNEFYYSITWAVRKFDHDDHMFKTDLELI